MQRHNSTFFDGLFAQRTMNAIKVHFIKLSIFYIS